MTHTEQVILTFLDAADEKSASWLDLRRASGCTNRGFRTVTSRMMNAGLIARADQHGLDVSITFGGLRAIRLFRGVA